MRFDQATYLRSDDGGILVAETDDGQYRVTEKRSDGWSEQFWMPADELHGLAQDEFEVVGVVSDEQFDQVTTRAQEYIA